MYAAQLDEAVPFDPTRFETPEWYGNGVDTTRECGDADDGRLSFHAYLACKGSDSEALGARVEDALEVCGQVAKSTGWFERQRLLSTIVRRYETREGRSRFIKGDRDTVEHAYGEGRYVRLVVQMVAVRPGLSKAKLSSKIGAVLAAADDFIFAGPCARLRVMGSL